MIVKVQLDARDKTVLVYDENHDNIYQGPNHCFRITFCQGKMTTKSYSYFTGDYRVPLAYFVNVWVKK